MSHDEKLARTRAFLAGVKWAQKAMMDTTTEGRQNALASFLARETFEDEETRRLVEGALRVER